MLNDTLHSHTRDRTQAASAQGRDCHNFCASGCLTLSVSSREEGTWGGGDVLVDIMAMPIFYFQFVTYDMTYTVIKNLSLD